MVGLGLELWVTVILRVFVPCNKGAQWHSNKRLTNDDKCRRKERKYKLE